jgi:hypothetical protein
MFLAFEVALNLVLFILVDVVFGLLWRRASVSHSSPLLGHKLLGFFGDGNLTTNFRVCKSKLAKSVLKLSLTIACQLFIVFSKNVQACLTYALSARVTSTFSMAFCQSMSRGALVDVRTAWMMARLVRLSLTSKASSFC